MGAMGKKRHFHPLITLPASSLLLVSQVWGKLRHGTCDSASLGNFCRCSACCCLEALRRGLKLNCANEFGRYYHKKRDRLCTATSLLNPSGARSQSKPVTMLAIKPRSQTPHLVSIHCLFRVMKSRLRELGLFASRGCYKKKNQTTLLQSNSGLGSEEQVSRASLPCELPRTHSVIQLPILYLIFKAINIKQITV